MARADYRIQPKASTSPSQLATSYNESLVNAVQLGSVPGAANQHTSATTHSRVSPRSSRSRPTRCCPRVSRHALLESSVGKPSNRKHLPIHSIIIIIISTAFRRSNFLLLSSARCTARTSGAYLITSNPTTSAITTLHASPARILPFSYPITLPRIWKT